MNAEQDPHLTDIERYDLVQSDHQVHCILSQCHFPASYTYMEETMMDNMSEFQREFIQGSSCMVCGNIPLKPKECYNCNKIICFLCELKITYKNGSRCRDFQCYNCKTQEVIKVNCSSEKSKSSGGGGNTKGNTQNNKGRSIRSGSMTPSTPGPNDETIEVIQHVYQPIKNKLFKQMIGQIKVNHRCRESAISQCVFVEDLEKHIENKCKGFAVECFCCQKKFHTYKGIFKHLKYDCQKLKINCQFCGNWLARETFRNKHKHYCYDDFCQVLDKFQGNINKLIEEDNSE